MPKVTGIIHDGLETNDGSVISGVDHIFVAVQKRKHIGEFVMVFQRAFVEIAKDRDLRGEAGAILNYLLGKMDYENYICVEQRIIAEDLNIHRTNVSTAMKLLVDKGVLIKGEKHGRNNTYRMNWQYAWRGKATSLDKTKKKTTRLSLAATNGKLMDGRL